MVVAEILLGQAVKDVLKRPGVREVMVSPEVEVKVTMPASGMPGVAEAKFVFERDREYPSKADRNPIPLSRGGHRSMATSDVTGKAGGKAEGEAVGVG
jgi:hypothetical protein